MARPPKITNEEILAAAREVFLEEGASASTLVIAEKAGISEASIFKRFATKKALFMEAMGISETPKWVKELSSKVPTANIKSELTEICEQMLAFYQEVLQRVLMTMNRGHLTLPPPPPQVRDTQLLSEFLDRAIALGYLRPCNSITVAHILTGAISNYVITENIRRSPIPIPFAKPKLVDPSVFIHNLIETVWSGISLDS